MYSQGEWKALQVKDDAPLVMCKRPDSISGYEFIASCDTPIRPIEQNLANANLIAAAVNACIKLNLDNPMAVAESISDLYEALKEARKDINWMLNNQQFLNPLVFEYIDKALTKGGDNDQ